MKNILKITLAVFLCLYNLITSAQKPDTILKGTDLNSIEFHIYNNGGSKLKFQNKEIEIRFNKPFICARISPDGTKAAVIQRKNLKDTNNSIIIFDKNGAEIKSFTAKATDIINYNSNGLLLVECVYNLESSTDCYTEISVLNENGNIIKSNEIRYFSRPNYRISPTGKAIIINGYGSSTFIKNYFELVCFLNSDFQLTGKTQIPCLIGGTIKKIDDTKEQLTLLYLSGEKLPGEKQIVVIDYKGNIIEKRKP